MPFPQLTTNGFTAGEDSSLFSEEAADPAIRSDFEGGFTGSRPRYTRAPVDRFTTGFTDISEADRLLLRAFYATVRGGSGSFLYIHPVSDDILTVRFSKAPKFTYAGMGGNHRWDVAGIELEVV